MEDQGQTEQAIDTYRQIVDDLDGTPEIATELSLFNKLGDLYLKERKVTEAVDMYERAAVLYSEHGFPNNAIALCNKILRNAPSRTSVYLKLAELMVERGFIAEAKQNLLEYADRMQKAGRTDEAFRALKEFADLSADNEEIRLMLAEQLKAAARDGEAREQLAKLFAEAESSGDERRTRETLRHIHAIDPDFDAEHAPKPKLSKKKEKSSELIFLDLDEEFRSEEPAATPRAVAPRAPVAEEPEEKLEIEATSADPEAPEAAADVEQVEGLEIDRGFFPADREDVGAPHLEIEPTVLDEPEADAPEAEPEAEEELKIDRSAELEVDEDVDEAGALPLIDVGRAEPSAFTFDVDDVDTELDVPDLDFGAELEGEPGGDEERASMRLDMAAELSGDEVAEAAPVAPPTIEDLERAVADDPDDAARHVALGEALVEQGERDRGIEELAIAVTMYEGQDDWSRAATLTDEILRLDPNSVRFRQKRVENAYRTGDRAQLTVAYLGLADALLRSGAVDRAQAVYRRVLEHDPGNAAARQALDVFGPTGAEAEAPAAPAPAARPQDDGDFVDLGAFVMDDEIAVKDTRMRIQEEEPTGDEERDFADMLSRFKRGIEQNIDEDDWQSHYDLGIAFKEMGLVDEGIAELQKALRDPAGRLKTAEALGACFIEKEQYSVAATVMKRAVEFDPRADEVKIGLLYWIGRCEEAQHRAAEALNWYQRVFALDIKFQDVSGRVKQLAKATNQG